MLGKKSHVDMGKSHVDMRFFSKRHVGKKSHVDMRFFHVNMRFFPNMHVEKKSHVNMEHLFLMARPRPDSRRHTRPDGVRAAQRPRETARVVVDPARRLAVL